MKYLQGTKTMPNGVPASQVRTVEAAQNALDALRDQIRSIENQLMSGRPSNVDEATDLRVWEIRARDALKAKRQMVEEITGAVALIVEERKRQLARLRLDRQEHARKLVRIERSENRQLERFHQFARAVRDQIGDEACQKIWDRLKEAGS